MTQVLLWIWLGLLASILLSVGYLMWKTKQLTSSTARRRQLLTTTPPPPRRFVPPSPVAAPVPVAAAPVTLPPRERKPKNTGITRVACPDCGKRIALTVTGKLYTHNMQTTARTCRGSGTRFVQYLIHEEPF